MKTRFKLTSAEKVVEQLRNDEQSADRDRAGLTARLEALELGMARKDGSAALLAAGQRVTGLLGSVASLITVEAGTETAIAAALGTAADAVAVSSSGSAVSAVELLKSDDGGRAGIIVADSPATLGEAVMKALGR